MNAGFKNVPFVDNRPEAVAQLKLQQAANNGPQSKKAAKYHAIANPTFTGHTPIQRKHILKDDRVREIDTLKEKYPAIENSSSSSITEKDDTFWDKHMMKKSLSVIIDEMLDKYLAPEQKVLPITVTLLGSTDPPGVRLIIEVDNHKAIDEETFKTRKTIFSLNQVFTKSTFGKFQVYIESVVATGGGKELFSNSLLPLYDSLKVKKISLSASRIGGGDDGVVAWARYGFLPDKARWEVMRQKGFELTKGNDEEWAQKLRVIASKKSPGALRELVLLSWENRATVTPILNDMLRATISWPGTVDLTNKNDRAWIQKYTSRADAEEFKGILK